MPPARRHLVEGADGGRRADLGGLLAEHRGPQRQFALALQGRRLGVQPARQHHRAQVRGDGRVVACVGELRVVDSASLGGQELDEGRIVNGIHEPQPYTYVTVGSESGRLLPRAAFWDTWLFTGEGVMVV